MGPSLASGTPTSTTHEPRFWAPPEHPNLASAHARAHILLTTTVLREAQKDPRMPLTTKGTIKYSPSYNRKRAGNIPQNQLLRIFYCSIFYRWIWPHLYVQFQFPLQCNLAKLPPLLHWVMNRKKKKEPRKEMENIKKSPWHSGRYSLLQSWGCEFKHVTNK